jgi:hypothetical protein
VILMGMAVPVVSGTLAAERAAIAARAVAGEFGRARMEALRRASAVAVKVMQVGERGCLQQFADGNGNGVLQRDIDRGVDVALSPPVWLDDLARGVSFRLNQPVADIGGGGVLVAGADPLRTGASPLVSFSPSGTTSTGTVYLAGREGPQFAVRMLGATGRLRVLRYDATGRRWLPW